MTDLNCQPMDQETGTARRAPRLIEKKGRDVGPRRPEIVCAPVWDIQSRPDAGAHAEMLEAAIARVTSALAGAADDVIAELVAERRALREECERYTRTARGSRDSGDRRPT